MREDCKFIGKTGWCELSFHEPEDLVRMCPICTDYEPKDELALDSKKVGEVGMNSLNEAISSIAYIMDSLRTLRDIYNSGDCNNCKRMNCEYQPKPGQLVRYNCPHYVMPDYLKRIQELKKD